MYNTLIQPQELKALLESEQPLLLDCRFSLADVAYGQRVYDEGHIPGAFYLHLDDDLSSPITPDSGRHPLPNPEQLANRLRELGLSAARQVVVYDDCGGAMASRCWWLLRWLGHDAVALLDGGYPNWIAQGGAVDATLPQASAADFQAVLRADINLSVKEVSDQLANGTMVLVDARGAERYRGEQEPIDPVAGHIPTAINRPLTDNLQDGCFKSADQLAQEWSDLLAGQAIDTVVHYCGSGVTACHNMLAMEIAGLSGTRIYSGSWSEWIRDPARPIATGEES